MTEKIKSTKDKVEIGGNQTAKSRIFIVDDHALFRDGLRHLIDHEPDLTVCGGAANAEEAMQGIGDSKPDLVTMDISLGDTSGIDLIHAIKAQYEDIPILVVSMHDESLYADRAMRAGAMGYVMKQEPSETVKTAIRKVLEGDVHLNEKIASSILVKLMRGSTEQPSNPIETLSDREMEIFRMFGHGKGASQIAEEMNLSINTINSFRVSGQLKPASDGQFKTGHLK